MSIETYFDISMLFIYNVPIDYRGYLRTIDRPYHESRSRTTDLDVSDSQRLAIWDTPASFIVILFLILSAETVKITQRKS